MLKRVSVMPRGSKTAVSAKRASEVLETDSTTSPRSMALRSLYSAESPGGRISGWA